MKTFTYGVIPFLVIIGFCGFLLMQEPHLSATIIIAVTGIVIIFMAGAHIGKLAALGVIGLAAVLWIVFGFGYGLDRINMWLDPTIDPRATATRSYSPSTRWVPAGCLASARAARSICSCRNRKTTLFSPSSARLGFCRRRADPDYFRGVCYPRLLYRAACTG